MSQGTESWLLTDRYRWADGVPQYPHFPGYQAADVVEEVGAEVEDLRVGDRVFAQRTPFADRAPRHGLASHTGFLVAPRAGVTKLDPSVDLGAASLSRVAGVSRLGVRLTGVARATWWYRNARVFTPAGEGAGHATRRPERGMHRLELQDVPLYSVTVLQG